MWTPDTVSSCQVVNNSFSTAPFKNGKPSLSQIDETFGNKFQIEKVAIKNQFSPTLDTLIKFKSANAEITFYKGSQSTFLYRAIIEDKNMLFSGDFSVGDSREKVNRALNLDSGVNCSTLTITDEEYFSKHQLTFEKNRLVKVVLDFGLN